MTKWEINRQVTEVVFPRAANREEKTLVGSTHGRDRNTSFARHVLPGKGSLFANQIRKTSRHQDLAAMLASPRTDVDNVVSHTDRVFVVLNDDHGIAEIAQPNHRFDQAMVVSLMQTDRRFV